MAKMKLDFKALLLNHAEKIGAGVVAVLGVAGLATANWSACTLDPLALRSDADRTKSTWLTSTLPDDKKKELDNTPAVEEMARNMLDSIEDTGKFATNRRWNAPISRSRQKLDSIIVMAPESPESSLVIFPLVEKNDEEEKKDADKEDAILLAITRNGEVFLSPGNKKLTVDEVPGRVRDLLTNRLDKTVYIKSDSRAKYETVVNAVDAVRSAGIEKLGLLTDKVPEGQQKPVY